MCLYLSLSFSKSFSLVSSRFLLFRNRNAHLSICDLSLLVQPSSTSRPSSPLFQPSFPFPDPALFTEKSLDLVFGMLFGCILANIPPLQPSEIIKCQRDFENMQSADKWYWFLLRLNKSEVGPIVLNCSVQGCYFLQFLQRIAKSVKRNYKEAY